jgi:hypothetical protein
LLRRSTGHKPANSEIDVPISYANYYLLEALPRRQALEAGQPLPVRQATFLPNGKPRHQRARVLCQHG